MKKIPKKLTLTRETLYQLTEEQAQAALGGADVVRRVSTDTVKACCS